MEIAAPEELGIPLPDGYVSYRTNTPVFSGLMPVLCGDPFFTMDLLDAAVVVPADAKPADVANALCRLAEGIEHGGPIRSLALPDLRSR